MLLILLKGSEETVTSTINREVIGSNPIVRKDLAQPGRALNFCFCFSPLFLFMTKPLICPLCGKVVDEPGPCEVCVPRLNPEESETFRQLEKLSTDDLFAILGSYEPELKDIIYVFLSNQPDRRLSLDVLIPRIRAMYPVEHAGSIKRAIRFLVDEGRAHQEQDILVLN